MEIKKYEPPTLYKRNAGESTKLNVWNINKHIGKLKVKCFQPRTTLILGRYAALKKEDDETE